MGLLKFIEIKKRKKLNEKYFEEANKIQEPIRKLIEKGNYDKAYKLAKETYQSDTYESFFRQTKLFICLKLIDLSYKLNKDKDADIYIEAYKKVDEKIEIHDKLGESYYIIGKVMFENGKKEKAREFLQKAYDKSKGTLFLTKEDKEKYLKFLNIKDDRTFEDFSEDY